MCERALRNAPTRLHQVAGLEFLPAVNDTPSNALKPGLRPRNATYCDVFLDILRHVLDCTKLSINHVSNWSRKRTYGETNSELHLMATEDFDITSLDLSHEFLFQRNRNRPALCSIAPFHFV